MVKRRGESLQCIGYTGSMATIIRATEADAESLVPLAAQLGYPTDVDLLQARLEAILGDTTHVVLLAVAEGGGVVGFIHLSSTKTLLGPARADVHALVVAEGVRGQGIGKLLMLAGEDWARTVGLSKVRLGSRLQRSDAHAFYERLGYSVTKEHRIYERVLG